MRASAGGGGGLPKPTKTGWHLVTFKNGDAALVRWTGKHWAWGSVKHPRVSTITGFSYLAPHYTDLSSAKGSAELQNAIRHLPAKQAAELAGLIDIGVTGQKGQPSLVHKTGQTSKASFAPGGDATAINQIPSPISPNASLPSLGSLGGVAVRVLEAVGAVLLLVIGLRVLAGGDAPTVQIAKVARKVAR